MLPVIDTTLLLTLIQEGDRVRIFRGLFHEDHRSLLLGLKRGQPDWNLLGIPEVQHLPAVMWKQCNLDRLPDNKRRELGDALERILSFSVVRSLELSLPMHQS